MNKHNKPTVFKFSHQKFDINRLRQDLSRFKGKFQNIHKANEGLCLNHSELASSVKNCFFQFPLTVCSQPIANFDEEACRSMNGLSGRREGLSATKAYRLASSRRKDIPSMDERNWNVPTEDYLNSYFKECVDSFLAPAIRVRLVKLEPGGAITPHIDYNLNYAVRVIVPIETNPSCANFFWRKGVKQEFHLEADGSAYFLNVGFKHAVENRGDTSRYCLMFSLADTRDLMDVPDVNFNLDLDHLPGIGSF